MARRTAKQRRKEKRIATALGGVLALALLVTLFHTVPSLEQTLYSLFGITQKSVVRRAVDSPTALHFVDVGQGDAVLIEQDGAFALFDAGPPEGREALQSYLWGAGVETLRYVFMSHPHNDHYGGMQLVLESFAVQTVVLPNLDNAPAPTAAGYIQLLETLLAQEVEVVTARQGDVYPLGGGSITVVHDGLETTDYNLVSTAILFEGGGLRFVATGDGEKQNEAAMLAAGIPLRADVFHAGHHGSSTSNTADFLSALRPAIVVVSCAEGNSYGHPHREAVENFDAVGAYTLRTDLHGHVVVQPDSEGGLAYTTTQEAA